MNFYICMFLLRTWGRSPPRSLYTKAQILSQFLKNNPWITEAVDQIVEINKITLA